MSTSTLSLSAPLQTAISPPALQNVTNVLRHRGIKHISQKPFIIGLLGQSNAVGNGEGGNLYIGPNIYIWNDQTNSPQLAVYGTYPLNTIYGIASTNIAVSAANARRADPNVDPNEPIYIVFSAIGGLSISNWVASKTVN